MTPPHTEPEPTPLPDPGGGDQDSRLRGQRDRRLAPIVEAFLRQIRSGGSLDPEPFLRVVSEDLREELEPILRGVLRLEQASEGLDSRRRLGEEWDSQG